MIHNERGGLRIRWKMLVEFGRMAEILDPPADISGEPLLKSSRTRSA